MVITWFTRSPVTCLIVCSVSLAPPSVYAWLILPTPWPGMWTFRSRGIDRYEIRWCDGSVRTSMIESECRSPCRPPTWAVSVPSRSTVVGCESSRPPCEVSASRALESSRLCASETPPENER